MCFEVGAEVIDFIFMDYPAVFSSVMDKEFCVRDNFGILKRVFCHLAKALTCFLRYFFKGATADTNADDNGYDKNDTIFIRLTVSWSHIFASSRFMKLLLFISF